MQPASKSREMSGMGESFMLKWAPLWQLVANPAAMVHFIIGVLLRASSVFRTHLLDHDRSSMRLSGT
jgi:hypothetical protein